MLLLDRCWGIPERLSGSVFSRYSIMVRQEKAEVQWKLAWTDAVSNRMACKVCLQSVLKKNLCFTIVMISQLESHLLCPACLIKEVTSSITLHQGRNFRKGTISLTESICSGSFAFVIQRAETNGKPTRNHNHQERGRSAHQISNFTLLYITKLKYKFLQF